MAWSVLLSQTDVKPVPRYRGHGKTDAFSVIISHKTSREKHFLFLPNFYFRHGPQIHFDLTNFSEVFGIIYFVIALSKTALYGFPILMERGEV
jgi:hypothetical protein